MKKIILFIITSLFFCNTWAETSSSQAIELHEQPDPKSKIVGTIAPNEALIPIFSKDHWLKVADPNNGNVGWISDEVFKQQNIPYIKIYTQKMGNPNSSSYQIIQYSGNTLPAEMNPQINQFLKNWQVQQQTMQQVFSQLLNQGMSNLNAMVQYLNEQEKLLNSAPSTAKNDTSSTSMPSANTQSTMTPMPKQ